MKSSGTNRINHKRAAGGCPFPLFGPCRHRRFDYVTSSIDECQNNGLIAEIGKGTELFGGLRHVKKRKHWVEHLQVVNSLDEIPAAPASFDSGRLQSLLMTNEISPGYSAVLTLHFEEQLSLAEVAEILEIPLGTVKSRLAYGLAALRKRLGDRSNY